jgi:hypothetical protein
VHLGEDLILGWLEINDVPAANLDVVLRAGDRLGREKPVGE